MTMIREFNSIRDLEHYAKDSGLFDSLKFTIQGPHRSLEAKWLDAFMGLFVIEGDEGFNSVRDWSEQTSELDLVYKVEENDHEPT